MTYILGTRSKSNLVGVHPDLVKVVVRALEITPRDFAVIEGRRSSERQKELFRDGKTKTLNSRHITGHAVDLMPYEGKDAAWNKCEEIAAAMLAAAKELGIHVRWGGDWNENGNSKDEKFYDGPHFELSSKEYPA